MTSTEKAQEIVHKIIGKSCIPMDQFHKAVELVEVELSTARREGRRDAANDLNSMIEGGDNAGRKDQPSEAL